MRNQQGGRTALEHEEARMMPKLPYLTLSAAVLALPMLAAPEPALAQRVNEIIVYGTDPCPRSTDD